MPNIFLPWIRHNQPSALKDIFGAYGVRFGMAAEAYMFDSAEAGLLKTHCAIVTSEISGKMSYVQPQRGVFDYSMIDALQAKCDQNGIKLFAHTGFWHIQNPDWLIPTLESVSIYEGYRILGDHIRNYCKHFGNKVVGIDIVNEAYAVMTGIGWSKYLGMECVKYAIKVARDTGTGVPLYYNSFFNDEYDAVGAIDVIPLVDGIGIQLHLETANDYTVKFDRIRRILDACKAQGKTARFSEVSVLDGLNSLDEVARVYRDTVRLMLEYPGTVTDYVVWGRRTPTWNGRHTLFDYYCKPTKAYYAVMKELRLL